MTSIPPEYQMQYNLSSALQQQQIQAEHSLASPYLQQSSQQVQAALVEQINPEKLLQDLKLGLLGLEERWEKNEIKLVQVGLPLMNEQGAMTMITCARSVVNQHTIMSAFEEKQISKLMITLLDAVIDDLTLNWKDYGIVQKTHLDIIHNMIMITGFAALNRGLNGGERKFLGTTTIENISTQPKLQAPKKEGFLSRFRI